MKLLLTIPLDQLATVLWKKIAPSYKKAFFSVIIINVLAFGFEMTNLTIHHDDVGQIFIKDHTFGYHVGRFGLGWLHYYIEDAHFLPFLQMLEGIAFMTAYGLLVAHFWELHKTLDIVLIAAIISVFPFMAQIYQYNTAMVAYPLAHLLSAAAVFISTRVSAKNITIAALLYLAAFSIYQSVIANAATIFLFWLIIQPISLDENKQFFSWPIMKSAFAALVSIIVGGIGYITAVSLLDINISTYQGADQAFHLEQNMNPSHIFSSFKEIVVGSRSFYFWPENYFPGYLKKVQLILILTTAIICLWVPKTSKNKAAALIIFCLSHFSPRLHQMLHPGGDYHNLTLTAYAVVISGCIMMIIKTTETTIRNGSIILSIILISGYIHQCNWITTVNYLNTQAHYATLTQILARMRSLQNENWDGKSAVVIGKYNMPLFDPFKKGAGVASNFIDAEHLQNLARLMRDEIHFLPEDQITPVIKQFAATHPHWPHPNSVDVFEGIAVITLSEERTIH